MCDIKLKKIDEWGLFQNLELLYNLCMYIFIVPVCFDMLKVNAWAYVVQYTLAINLTFEWKIRYTPNYKKYCF